jgi:hypothetical protein
MPFDPITYYNLKDNNRPLVIMGPYVYHPKKTVDVYTAYYFWINNRYVRKVRHQTYQSNEAATFNAQRMGKIYTTDAKIFKDQG